MSLPYDPEGKNPLNLKTETKRLSDTPNKAGAVVPTYAPFFKKDLLITTVDDRPLLEGFDYYLAFHYSKGSGATRQSIFGGIILINADIDEVKFSRYRSLGGNHLVSPTTVAKFLVDPELPDPRSTDWQEILTKDVIIEPIDPPGSLEEALEVDPVLSAIRHVTESIEKGTVDSSKQLTDLVVEVEALYNRFYGSGIHTHINSTGHYAHAPTADDLNAAKRDDVAPNVTYLHNRTKDDVVSAIRSICFNDSDLAELASKSEAEILGVLSIATGKKIVVSDSLTFDTTDGLTINNGTSTFYIEVERGENGRAIFRLVCNGNVVSLSATRSDLLVNGKPILPSSRANEFINPNLGSTASIFVKQGKGVSLYGTGTDGDKLRGNATLEVATSSKIGKFRVEDTNTDETIATSGRLYNAWELLNQLAEEEFTINGKRYFDGFTLDASDFNLSTVNNTEPSRKALNDKFVEALTNKIRTTHRHNMSTIDNIIIGDESTAGMAKYGHGGIASYNSIYTAFTNLANMDGLLGGYLPVGLLEGYYFDRLNISERYDVVTGDHFIVIDDFKLIEGNKVMEVAGGEFKNYNGVISVVGGALSTASDGKVVCIRKNNKIYSLPRFHYGMNRGWLEHTLDPSAHKGSVTKGFFTLIDNLAIRHIYNKAEDEFLKGWTRHSHEFYTETQPAKPEDLDKWELEYPHAVTKTATHTFTYLQSPAVSEYETDCLFSFDPNSTNAKGEVCVVLGGWEGDTESNLTLVFSNKTILGTKECVFASVWSNYNSPSQFKLADLVTTEPMGGWENYLIHVRSKLVNGVVSVDFALIDKPSDTSNIENELLYLDLKYHNYETTIDTFSRNNLVGYGFGVKGVAGVKVKYLEKYDSNEVEQYASHSYLKGAFDKLTPQPVVEELKTQLTFDLVEDGVWRAIVSGSFDYELQSLLDFHYTLDSDFDGDNTLLTLKAVYKTSTGESLYEPPTDQLNLDFSKVTLL